VLVSRSQERLKQTADEIKQSVKQSINIETLAIDFDNFDEAAEQSVKQVIDRLDVGILINNVGMSYSYPEFFDQLSAQTVNQLVNLNINSTIKMTHLVLPKMLAKKKGLVVNMSSASALVPSPLLLEYHCVKNFVVDFTRGLNDEYASQGLVFQVQCPLYVTSKLSKFKRASLMIPSPRTYAQASLKSMGHASEVVSVPYWPHAAQMAVTNLLPRFALAQYIKGMHLSIRKKALKKAAETKKE
jgi:17beta-estradiol 17-dehydrogenase / very-long-chain 3-oxoacyl-CoA reductase